MSEIKGQMDLSQIRYSMVWEDEDLLTKNLEISGQSRVLSIGSAGCNSFSLLLKEPQELHIVDMSPAQMALIRLKMAAISTLNCQQFLEFFGYRQCQNRRTYFELMSGVLSPDDSKYWGANWHLIESGLCEQGRLEKFFAHFREKYLHLIWPQEFRKKLIQSHSPAAQMELINNSQTKPQLEKAATEFFGRQGLEQGRDPAQMKYVTQKDIGQRFYRLFIDRLAKSLISENFFLFYFIEGSFPLDERVLPDYLQQQNFSRLKGLLTRIHLHETDLFSALKTSINFSSFNLSDIFEYMSEAESGELMKRLGEKSTANAQLAYWTLLVDRKPMPPWHSEDKLQGEDRLWFYENFYFCSKV